MRIVACLTLICLPWSAGCRDTFADSDGETTGTETADDDSSDATEGEEADTDATGDTGDSDTTADDDSTDGTDTGGDDPVQMCGAEPVPFGFEAGGAIAVGAAPIDLAAGDFFGTGADDLIVMSNGTGEIWMLEGNGNALFPNSAVLFTDANVRSMEVADLDGDDTYEIIVPTEAFDDNANALAIFQADPDDTTQTPVTSPTTVVNLGITLADVDDDDARDDLIVAGSDIDANGRITLATRGEGLEFQVDEDSVAPFGVMPWHLAVGDLDGDLRIDFVVADVDESNVVRNDQVFVFTAAGGPGNYALWDTIEVGNDPRGVALADLDGDQELDMVVAIYDASNAAAEPDVLEVWIGDGSGGFDPGTSVVAGSGPVNLVAHDINCDDNVDLLFANELANNVGVALGNGDGTFAETTTYPAGSSPSNLAVGDFDGNGLPDLAVTNWMSNDVSLLLATE